MTERSKASRQKNFDFLILTKSFALRFASLSRIQQNVSGQEIDYFTRRGLSFRLK
jgi:hypothetical protein